MSDIQLSAMEMEPVNLSLYLRKLEFKKSKQIAFTDVMLISLERSWKEKNIKKVAGWKKILYRLKLHVLELIYFYRYGAITTEVEYWFVISEPTHLRQLLPLAMTLKKSQYIFITNKVKLLRSLLSQKQPVHFLSSKWSGRTQKNILPLNQIKEIGAQLPDVENRIYNKFVTANYPNYKGMLTALDKLISDKRPQRIFVGNDLTPEGRTVCLLAKESGVPTVCVQHGLIAHEWTNAYHVSDEYWVYGSVFRDILIKDGYPDERIKVIGAPYLQNRDVSAQEEIILAIKNNFELIKNEYVLVALSGFGHRTSYDNYIASIENLMAVAAQLPDLPFIFKLHRKDSPKAYIEIGKKYGLERVLIAKNDNESLPKDIFDWFHGCRCLITGTSTVAIEAMLAGVPVASLDPLNEFEDINFLDHKEVWNIEEESDLLGFVEKSKFMDRKPIQHIGQQYFSPFMMKNIAV